MTTSIKFPPATLSRLQAEAETSGKDIDTFVTEAVEAKMALSRRSLRDVQRPINEAIAASGTTPEEAESFFGQEVSAMRAERKPSSGKKWRVPSTIAWSCCERRQIHQVLSALV